MPNPKAISPDGGRYQLIRLLGSGGMAEVFLARSRGAGGVERVVVIKRPIARRLQDAHFKRMFLDEARIAATLHHPNIAQVLAVEELSGSVSIVMEFLHGHDVRELVQALRAKGQRLPLEHALAIGMGVCAGLSYAHDRKDLKGTPLEIVHRDVSPHNVFVTYDGSVKLIDFGIARAASRSSDTDDGTIKGKLGYMAPEQVTAGKIDRRTDLFALGILLYELTANCRLFENASDFQTMHSIVYEDPVPPTRRDPGYSPSLEAIVMKCLAREPHHRYQSARELQLDLEQFIRDYRLPVSSVGLADFLGGLFHDEITGWRNASQAGMTLGDHLAEKANQGPATETANPPADIVTAPEARPRPPRRFVKPVLVMVGLGLAAGLVVGLWLQQSQPASAPPPASASASAPAPAPDPAPAAPAPASAPTPAPAAAPDPAPLAAKPPVAKTPRKPKPPKPPKPPTTRRQPPERLDPDAIIVD